MAATTEGTEDHTAAPASRRPPVRRRRMGRIAMAVSVFGELLITAGLVLGLFVVYSLWWTNVIADRAADKQADKVRDIWAHQDDGSGRPAEFDAKNGIGFLHVPAMTKGEILVEKGTTSKILNDGVAGYYTDPVKATLPTSDKKGTSPSRRTGTATERSSTTSTSSKRATRSSSRRRTSGTSTRSTPSSPRPRSTTSRSSAASRRNRAGRRPATTSP